MVDAPLCLNSFLPQRLKSIVYFAALLYVHLSDPHQIPQARSEGVSLYMFRFYNSFDINNKSAQPVSKVKLSKYDV